MIEKNLKVITAHLNNNTEEKNNAIKEMLNVSEKYRGQVTITT